MTDELVAAAADLYALIERSEGGVASRFAREAATELAERLCAARPEGNTKLCASVDAAVTELRRFGSAPADRSEPDAWRVMSRRYEALSAALRHRGRVSGAALDRIKPRNLGRNIFHVHNGVIGVVLYELGVRRWTLVSVAAIILGGCIIADVARRIVPRWNRSYTDGAFAWLTRPADAHETPSSTWFISGLLIGTAIYPQHGIELGVLILALADPAAALAGKAWGRTKLYRDRTAVGTVTFAVTAFTVAVGFLSWARPEVATAQRVTVAAAAALAGTLAELFAGRTIDDNFSIPLISGGVASLLL